MNKMDVLDFNLPKQQLFDTDKCIEIHEYFAAGVHRHKLHIALFFSTNGPQIKIFRQNPSVRSQKHLGNN